MGEIEQPPRPKKFRDPERRSQQKRPKRRDMRFWPFPTGYIFLIAIGLLAVSAISYLVTGALRPSGSGVDNSESKLTSDMEPADAVPASTAPIFELCTWNAQTDCVVEGDTIRYKGVRIRIEDIDAPETKNYKCAMEFGLGQQATARLVELLNAGPFDVVQVGQRAVDPSGRQLRTLSRNGQSLGLQLVAEGLARRWEGKRSNWCP